MFSLSGLLNNLSSSLNSTSSNSSTMDPPGDHCTFLENPDGTRPISSGVPSSAAPRRGAVQRYRHHGVTATSSVATPCQSFATGPAKISSVGDVGRPTSRGANSKLYEQPRRVATTAIPQSPAQLNTVIVTDDKAPEQYSPFDIPDGMTADEQSRSERCDARTTRSERRDATTIEKPPVCVPTASSSAAADVAVNADMKQLQLVTSLLESKNVDALAAVVSSKCLDPIATRYAQAGLAELQQLGHVSTPGFVPSDISSVSSGSTSSVGKGGGGGVAPDHTPIEKKSDVVQVGSFPCQTHTEAAALKAVSKRSSEPITHSRLGVSVPRDKRLKPGERGYIEQKESMTRGLKVSQQIGICDYAVPGPATVSDLSLHDKLLSDHLLKYFAKFELLDRQLLTYDLDYLLGVCPLLPGIQRRCSVDVPPVKLFDVSSQPLQLTDNWGMFDVHTIRIYQRYVKTSPYMSGVDKQTSELLMEYLMNCVTPALHKKVSENIAEFFTEDEVGGISVYWTILRTAFTLVPSSMDSLRSELEEFGEKGLMSVPGQSPVEARLKLRVIIYPLVFVQGLRATDVGIILNGLKFCSCAEFNALFNEVYISNLRSEISVTALDQPLVIGSAMDQQTIAKTILGHLDTAVELFLSLKRQSKWTHSATGKDLSAYQFRADDASDSDASADGTSPSDDVSDEDEGASFADAVSVEDDVSFAEDSVVEASDEDSVVAASDVFVEDPAVVAARVEQNRIYLWEQVQTYGAQSEEGQSALQILKDFP